MICRMILIEFSSDKFLPYLPEACQSNPGVYGFELALWLSQALMREALPTSYPLEEDWGWFIEYIDGEAEFMLGCSSLTDEGDGYRGRPLDWRIFVKQQLSLKQRFKGHTEPKIAATLTDAIVAALRSEGIDPHVC